METPARAFMHQGGRKWRRRGRDPELAAWTREVWRLYCRAALLSSRAVVESRRCRRIPPLKSDRQIASHFSPERAGDNREYFHSADTRHEAVREQDGDDTTHS